MAKITLTEQQFKNYMRMIREEEKKKAYIKQIVAEALANEANEDDYEPIRG